MVEDIHEVSVVFHLDEPDKTGMTLKNMTNLLADESIRVHRLALVVNGEAIIICLKNSKFEEEIALLLREKAEVYACRNAMKAKGITESDLIDGIVSVPSGVGRLAVLQRDHFAYIRP
jgi:uncharacterized protein